MFDEAEYAFKQSVDLYPLSPEANFRLADIYMQMRRYTDAKNLIREFVRDRRIVIFCSHILEVVERLCDRLMILHRGRKMIEGTPGDIMAGTETDSLGGAFSRLTGAADIQSQARGILDAIGGPQP